MKKVNITKTDFLYTRDNLRNRIKQIKYHLPKNYSKMLRQKYPEYQTSEGINLVKNVVGLRSTDVKITEILEEIVTEFLENKNTEIYNKN